MNDASKWDEKNLYLVAVNNGKVYVRYVPFPEEPGIGVEDFINNVKDSARAGLLQYLQKRYE